VVTMLEKKTKGRKRHIAVDTLGLLLMVVVHSAGIQDRVGVKSLLIKMAGKYRRLESIFADGGYTGTLIAWCFAMFHWNIKIIKRNETKGFKVLPKRWVVERTFGWFIFRRRLSKDYEHNPRSSEAMVQITMIHLMLKRLVV
jgi:putative transposase